MLLTVQSCCSQHRSSPFLLIKFKTKNSDVRANYFSDKKLIIVWNSALGGGEGGTKKWKVFFSPQVKMLWQVGQSNDRPGGTTWSKSDFPFLLDSNPIKESFVFKTVTSLCQPVQSIMKLSRHLKFDKKQTSETWHISGIRNSVFNFNIDWRLVEEDWTNWLEYWVEVYDINLWWDWRVRCWQRYLLASLGRCGQRRHSHKR